CARGGYWALYAMDYW
nr:immunoglobulin heavy chain junction region [Mus musculus]MBK4196815.1 immunoglobulin heavy chain junction region [Mus musculus]MBK4196816.1 immunoglobulin heavy chain junction region [Mus musculus]MBK4196817.1 immunoglobulin heavy chain junction region [Mus musculus]MBK4196818.1 immunoglobulin heavy chain junction region [Mus musculus]